jgi:hypothetical protein
MIIQALYQPQKNITKTKPILVGKVYCIYNYKQESLKK